METAVLIKPDAAYKKAYMSFYHEWKASGEKMIPWVIAKDPAYFEKMVQELLDAEKGIGLKKRICTRFHLLANASRKSNRRS